MRIRSIALGIMTALVVILSGCSAEPTPSKVERACIGHGGVYHVEHHEQFEENIVYVFVCEDKTVQVVTP